MGRLGYRPALDGLRGLAVLGVVSHHVFRVPRGGGFGVDLFFVLSGFLITTLLLEERERTGSISFGDFYRRRALRLLPALVAMLASLLVVLAIKARVEGRPELFRAGAKAVAATGFYTANITAAFHKQVIGDFPVAHLWSLAAEEQFYLVWPAVLYGLLRFGVRRRGLIWSLGALILAVNVERILLFVEHVDHARIYSGPDTHSDGLLMGALLAVALTGTPKLTRDRALGAFSIIPLALLAYDPFFVWEVGISFVNLACAGLVATVVVQPDSVVTRAAALKPLVLVGRISYGLYVWHMLPLWLVGRQHAWLAVPLAFALAGLSYRYVEQPFLKKKRARAEKDALAPAPALTG
jgi:peptidoglycan/LPS O-acetylase OafA/YrhL